MYPLNTASGAKYIYISVYALRRLRAARCAATARGPVLHEGYWEGTRLLCSPHCQKSAYIARASSSLPQLESSSLELI